MTYVLHLRRKGLPLSVPSRSKRDKESVELITD
jgi:hypothetical protein